MRRAGMATADSSVVVRGELVGGDGQVNSIVGVIVQPTAADTG
jgi:hypothetical protein